MKGYEVPLVSLSTKEEVRFKNNLPGGLLLKIKKVDKSKNKFWSSQMEPN